MVRCMSNIVTKNAISGEGGGEAQGRKEGTFIGDLGVEGTYGGQQRDIDELLLQQQMAGLEMTQVGRAMQRRPSRVILNVHVGLQRR